MAKVIATIGSKGGSGKSTAAHLIAHGCGSLPRPVMTVLLTTHYMFEADMLCDRIAVIARGRIVGEGTPEELKAGVADGWVTEIEVFGVGEATVARLRELDGVTAVTVEDREHKQLLIVQATGERPLAVAALHVMTTLTGSVLLALAAAEDALSTEAAWDAAHVDEDFQVRAWGIDVEAMARREKRWAEFESAARLLRLVA